MTRAEAAAVTTARKGFVWNLSQSLTAEWGLPYVGREGASQFMTGVTGQRRITRRVVNR
jgi:hypothetical protein